MKKTNKYVLTPISLLFISLFLSSCRDANIDDKILRESDFFKANLEVHESVLERFYDDFEREIKHTPTDTADLDNIFSPLYTFNNNRFYFVVRRRYETNYRSTGIGIYSYIDLNTGEHRLICPDPLCRHSLSECRYVNLTRELFFAAENIFYTSFIEGFNNNVEFRDMRESIYGINLNTDRVDIVHRSTKDFTKQYITVEFIYNNKLYFFVATLIEEENERRMRTIRELKSMDLSTYEIVEIGNLPTEFVNKWTSIMFISENTFYFQSLQNIFSTDRNFENKKIIYSFQPNEWLEDYFFDNNTKELFFLIRNRVMHTGTIYVYRDGELIKLDMPHENIFSFQLTNSKIYYSPFNPNFLGISIRDDLANRRIYNYTSGRIYVTDRHNRESYELIFT